MICTALYSVSKAMIISQIKFTIIICVLKEFGLASLARHAVLLTDSLTRQSDLGLTALVRMYRSIAVRMSRLFYFIHIGLQTSL